MFAHAVEYRIFILGARLFRLPTWTSRFPAPYGTASGPPLGVVGRRAGSSGAVGVGRHYSIWKGLYGPYAAGRALRSQLVIGPPLCLLARTG
jgi:hypothetical protein